MFNFLKRKLQRQRLTKEEECLVTGDEIVQYLLIAFKGKLIDKKDHTELLRLLIRYNHYRTNI